MSSALGRTLREMLSRRDWVYLLSLLLPLAVYNLVLKGVGITARDPEAGPLGVLNLMRSDVLFNAGYAVFWIGLFAITRRGLLRKVVVVLFHAVTLLVVATTTTAYQYLQATGSTLDYSIIVFYLGTLGEVKDIIASEAPPHVWVFLITALLYVIIGPWLIVRAGLWGSRPTPGGNVSRLAAVGLCMMAAGIGTFSLVPATTDSNRAFSLSPVVNVLITGVSAPSAEELTVEEASATAISPLKNAKLVPTAEAEKRNVVLIHLESVRERSMDPYNPDADTTPFMDDLADESLLVERAYTTTPHTSKAITSINCGIYPHPQTDINEAESGGVPARCLPALLGEHGYRSVFFQSATSEFENRPQIVENFGYDDYYGLEDMDKKGFEKAGYLGYEDDIMLEPSRKWLEENGEEPFMATYVTITPHHEWLAPDRYGNKDYGEEDRLNRYLNTVRYVDFFVKNLIEQYKDLGLYEDTIFVLYGDHGEGFGEHGVRGHDNVIHEEGLRVPLIIHDPQRWRNGERTDSAAPVNHMDVPPTILDMLGYGVVGGEYPGIPVYDAPDDRTLYMNCRPDLLCMASVRGYEKYIYHYGKQPDEFYDLERDPLEKNNLAEQVPDDELERRRNDLLKWRSGAAATFERAKTEPE